MQLLEQRILAEGEVKSSEILKVDRFLNHQMDPKLFLAMAEEWKRLFDGCGVNKLVTIEASGIGSGRARVRLSGRVRQENQEPQRLRRCVHDGRALVHTRQ